MGKDKRKRKRGSSDGVSTQTSVERAVESGTIQQKVEVKRQKTESGPLKDKLDQKVQETLDSSSTDCGGLSNHADATSPDADHSLEPVTTILESQKSQTTHHATNRAPPSQRRKRAPLRPPTRETDIYVSRKSARPALFKRAKKLLNQGKTVTIHGLGAAVKDALSLAIALQNSYRGRLSMKTSTHTVELVDDIEPEDEDDDIGSELRLSPAIRVEVRSIDTDVSVKFGA
ncbi:hypothetical protein M427DRAFT_172091 [Gonapodya prolifera JEL478]|uniref:Uncharacterized protein n=1 Tax=Gonapodya prolifera (strain JEL478) TaxID=1344416 RepID=A0A139B0F5_GONPJ|nr:hypothetical protein M427DRAFT_172091 [Gonapodya prolifera JEL478]|eukprot:KXS22420.1 hypothetical protein M427DRAFT_172091 [Gonapodya prolifera JEL478]